MDVEPRALDRMLFPVDFSDQNRVVAPLVKEMAARFDSELIVLHVIEIPAGYYLPPDAAGWDMLSNTEEFCATRKAALEAFIAEEFRGVEAIPHCTEGHAAHEIIQYAHEEKISLIMMPTHGYGSFRRFLLGSVTAKVLHDAACPIWPAVHVRESGCDVPNLPRRIVCAVDTHPDALRVIQWARGFCKALEAEMTVIHAVPGTEDAPSELVFAYRKHLRDEATRQLRRVESEASLNSRITVYEGEPDQIVKAAAKEADLVIIGRGRIQQTLGRLRNHAYAIIREAPCPVISV